MEPIYPHVIPAWAISVSALLAALSLSRVRPMPWRIRVSLCLPLVYFAIVYAWASINPLEPFIRTDLIRMGLMLILISIIVNSVLASSQKSKGHRI